MPGCSLRPLPNAAAALAIVVGLAAAVFAQSNQPPARYSAVAMDLERGGAVQMVIAVDRWTSQAEYDRVMKVMFDQGSEALLETLQRTPRVGYIQTPPSLGWPIYLAQRTPGEDGGEKVFLLTDRPLSFGEAAGRTRSSEYPFTVVELQLKSNGEGEGTLSLATKIIPVREANTVVLENFELQRIRLTQVRRTSR
jgi:hypothetical protein